jgi:hypothetical protein
MLNEVNPDVSGGVAVWAHVGGFVAGVVLVKLFENRARFSPNRDFGRPGCLGAVVFERAPLVRRDPR